MKADRYMQKCYPFYEIVRTYAWKWPLFNDFECIMDVEMNIRAKLNCAYTRKCTFAHAHANPALNDEAYFSFFKQPRITNLRVANALKHGDVIKWKHFPRYWPFVRRIHRSPVNSPHKGQWHGALMLSLICVWINDWVNNGEAGDLRRYRIHYDVTVMDIKLNLYWFPHYIKLNHH